MRRPLAVLLDMDGTLVDAFAPIIHALNCTLKEFGLPTMSDTEVKRHTGKGECSMISLFGEHREIAARRFLEFHDQRMFDIQPLPGAENLLQWLYEHGIPAAIVTSKSQSRAEIQIEHLGWTRYFSAVVGLSEGRRQKPDPHTLQIACRYLDIAPAQTFMIGDGTADMKAAAALGSQPIGISGHFSPEELREAGAVLCFPNLNEVKSWLETAIC